MKIQDGLLKWGGPRDEWYYISVTPNWLPRPYRYWGFRLYYHDGNHHTFGFWWFNVGWSLPTRNGT